MKKVILTMLCIFVASPSFAEQNWSQYNDQMIKAYKQQNYPAAITYAEKALASAIKQKGANDALTFTSQNNLAKLYHLNKAYEKALPLFEKTLKARQSLLGESHRETLISATNLVKLYLDIDSYDRALPLAVKLMKASLNTATSAQYRLDAFSILAQAVKGKQHLDQQLNSKLVQLTQQNKALMQEKQSSAVVVSDMTKEKAVLQQQLKQANNQVQQLQQAQENAVSAANSEALDSMQQKLIQANEQIQQLQQLNNLTNDEKQALAKKLAVIGNQPQTNMISKKSCFSMQEKALNQMTRCQEENVQLKQQLEQKNNATTRVE